jgi:hypothetical protein
MTMARRGSEFARTSGRAGLLWRAEARPTDWALHLIETDLRLQPIA